MQTGLKTGDYYLSANSLSTVTPNPANVRCTDTFMIHVHDTGYVAALFQVALADTSGISPHTINFINLSDNTDSAYTSATNMHFVDLINLPQPTAEVDAEYEWRFYHIRYDSLPNFDSTAVIFPWEDPIEIDGETVFSEASPSITFTEAGHYKIQLIVINSEFESEGCRDTIVVGYPFIDAESDIVPGVNVFTPNGDGQNDFLEFETATLKSMRGQIFSRWGKLVYEWTWNEEDQAPDPGWWDGKLSNGQDAAPGVYFYVIEGVGLDDTEFSGKQYAKAFHLIREK
jgi:gliding motility-associated-like protein